MSYLEGCGVTDWDKKVATENRDHVIELSIENCFQENLFELDPFNRTKIDPSRSSHRELFASKMRNNSMS